MPSRDTLLRLISFIDLTSLESTDNEVTIQALIRKANVGYAGVHPAAVCVYPNFGNYVTAALLKSIQTAVVGGYFPSGQTPTEVKIKELEAIEKSTADEVDIVINRGEFLQGHFEFVKTEIQKMRSAVPTKKLKVILETGDLKSEKNIEVASQIAIDAGADFIKTSTGKSQTGATTDAVKIMCHVIRSHFEKTGKKIGIKPSGGIRTIEDALEYTNLVETILGSEWMTPSLFRIGASTLYDNLIKDLKHADNL